MRQNESVLNFHDRLSAIVRAATKLKNEGIDDEDIKRHNKSLFEDLATEYFIRGLPSVIRNQMSNHNPVNFSEALNAALNAEEWVNIGAPNRADVEYSSTQKPPPRSRSPSPYGRPGTPERESSHDRRNVKFSDFNDPRNFDRNISYSYDPNDIKMPRTMTYTAEGKLDAHPSLRYEQPSSILKNPERQSLSDQRSGSSDRYSRPRSESPRGRYPNRSTSPLSPPFPYPNFHPYMPYYPPMPYYYPPAPMPPFHSPYPNAATPAYFPNNYYDKPPGRPGSPGPYGPTPRAPTPTNIPANISSSENLNWRQARPDGAPASFPRSQSPERRSVKTFKTREYGKSVARKPHQP